MKSIYVVTHTESHHHVEARVGGWYDTALTPFGKQQAHQVAAELQELINQATPKITASDLLRASETAEIVAQAFGTTVAATQDLREVGCGIAEGKPDAWLQERLVPAPDDNRLDHRIVEGAETRRECLTRIYRRVDELIADSNSIHIIVTHGFALTFVIARWIGLPLEAAGWVNFASTPGGITQLNQEDFWRNRGIGFLNRTSHLG
ncbi:MAG: histidine phosphatase family protein [Pseudomonadales bacterium]|nr:histidine phosphatase family protein [Pseudomonadales bacterium]